MVRLATVCEVLEVSESVGSLPVVEEQAAIRATVRTSTTIRAGVLHFMDCLLKSSEEWAPRSGCLLAALGVRDVAIRGVGGGLVPNRSWRLLRSWELRPASACPGAEPATCTKLGLNLGTWPELLPAPSGVCTAGCKRVSLSQLCGG